MNAVSQNDLPSTVTELAVYMLEGWIENVRCDNRYASESVVMLKLYGYGLYVAMGNVGRKKAWDTWVDGGCKQKELNFQKK